MVIFRRRRFFVSLPEGIHLVGGAITILKNMSSSIGRIIPYIVENKNVWNDQPVIYEWVLMGWWPSLNIHRYTLSQWWSAEEKQFSYNSSAKNLQKSRGRLQHGIRSSFFVPHASFMRSLSMPKQVSAPSLPAMDGDFSRTPGSNEQQLRCHLVQRCLAPQSHLCFGRRAPGSPRHHFQRYALVRGGSHHGSVPKLTTIQRAFGLSTLGESHRSLPASSEIHPTSAEVRALGAPAASNRGDPSSQQRSPMRTRKVLNFSAWPQETGHQSLQKHGDRNPPRKLAESSRPHLCESLLPGCSSGWNSKPQGTGHRC